MKIAVSTDSGQVAEHFGRCPQFTVAEIEDGKVVKQEVIENPGHATGFLPKFFSEMGVECIVAGGAGFRAQEFCNQYGIRLVVGVHGKVEDALKLLADGRLKGKEGSCSPGAGRGYGIPKEDGHGK